MCEPRLSLSRVEFRTPVASHADLYRSLLGDIPGVSVVDGPLLEGCVADAVIAPTNSFGYLDAGIDSAFARRFGRRLQRSLQERIGCEFDAEMPIGQAAVIPSGDLALPFVVAAPATQFPGVIAVEPMIYRSLLAALRAIDAWNLADEGPIIESVIMPDIARIVHGWDADRLILQLREALEEWRRESDRRFSQARAA
jgi:O-acetyl-ADP-ribose deacetylase (regulator of RNase III)